MPKLRKQKNIIAAAAHKYGIAPAILWGLYGAESNFGHNHNDSRAGAQGPFQFMPGTADSYGINPHNFRQAAFAAAKYLSTYKDRGVDGMLAAYNAGPAGDPNNPETRAYVPKVKQLATSWTGARRASRAGGPGQSNRAGLPSRSPGSYTIPGIDNSSLRQRAMLSYLDVRGKPGALLELKQGLDAAQDVPGRTVRVASSGTVRERGKQGGTENRAHGRTGGLRVGGELLEMFYNGPGGVNVKNGKREPKGFVSGHEDHVHVAGKPGAVDKLGRLAQRMGLHVSENETFDHVDPVHVQGSYHYRDMAIDVSGDPKKMARFSRRVAKIYGV